jgi:glutathione synthase/RimK-type ligase-like ATP-grasp enzyme
MVLKDKKVLIITNSYDEHAHTLVPEIERLGGVVYRMDVDRLHTHFSINIDFNSKKPSFTLTTPVGKISSREVFSAWFRRPCEIFTKISSLEQKLITQEIRAIVKSLPIYLPKEALVVNHPTKVILASNKPRQIKLAKKVGLKIPPTIITSSVQKAKKFIKSHSKVVVKAIDSGLAEYDNKFLCIHTSELKEDIDLSLIKNCPTLLQKRIDKKTELRITIIGKKVFVVEFEPRQIPEADVDWRKAVDKVVKLPHRVVKLPKDVEKKLLNILNYYKLNFGAIDMAITPKKEYIFFEINPNGQFLWLDGVTKLNLGEEMAKYLLGIK